MQEYHVYCLNLEGRSVDTKQIMAASDEEAVRKAQGLKGLRQCEVWSERRLVARITEFSAALA